jgi:hypothetical protein
LILDHLDALRHAARKRNHIVHAFWREREVIETNKDDPSANRHYTEMFREYAKPRVPFGSTPTSEEEEQELRGDVRFYLDDLREVRDLFGRLLPQTIEVTAEVVKAKRPNPFRRP